MADYEFNKHKKDTAYSKNYESNYPVDSNLKSSMENVFKKAVTLDDIDIISKFSKFLQEKKMTVGQIRKFYGELKKIQANYDDRFQEIPFLKAKLAYASGRESGNKGLKLFYEVISIGLSTVTDKKSFDHFVSIAESIVAFHKFHGGQ